MKWKQFSVILSFFGVLVAFGLAFFFLPDRAVSTAERRPLTRFQTYEQQKFGQPDYDLGDYFSFLEQYALEQFPGRDSFRSLKAIFVRYALGQRDSHGYYCVDSSLSRLDTELNQNAVEGNVQRLNQLYSKYFLGSQLYYAVIPDKNYYLAGENGYPHYDYDRLNELVGQQMPENAQEIDLRPYLSADSYYRTDPHWNQAQLLQVADGLLTAMDAAQVSGLPWKKHELPNFYGTYYGQAALPVKPDTLVYLGGQPISQVTVLENGTPIPMYSEENFKNVDPYDVFLNGAVPLLTLKNAAQDNGKRLIVFRDSFGSSIIPLLAPSYSEIILVDIRYVSPKLLPTMIPLGQESDVLFLYSTSVLNTYGTFPD